MEQGGARRRKAALWWRVGGRGEGGRAVLVGRACGRPSGVCWADVISCSVIPRSFAWRRSAGGEENTQRMAGSVCPASTPRGPAAPSRPCCLAPRHVSCIPEGRQSPPSSACRRRVSTFHRHRLCHYRVSLSGCHARFYELWRQDNFHL